MCTTDDADCCQNDAEVRVFGRGTKQLAGLGISRALRDGANFVPHIPRLCPSRQKLNAVGRVSEARLGLPTSSGISEINFDLKHQRSYAAKKATYLSHASSNGPTHERWSADLVYRLWQLNSAALNEPFSIGLPDDLAAMRPNFCHSFRT